MSNDQHGPMGMPQDLFHVPPSEAVNEGESVFAPTGEHEITFGAPVPPVAAPVPPVPPVPPVEHVAPVPPVPAPVPPVPPVEHVAPVPPVAAPVPPVPPVEHVAPVPPVVAPLAFPAQDSITFTPADMLQPSPAASGRGPAGRLRRYTLGALATSLVAGIAVGGYAFATGFFGTGPQPEDVIPGTAVAFTKIDLNPSADQKVNALRLLRKFPAVQVNETDLKQTLLADALTGNPYGLTYDGDIAPWLGDRAAFAAIPAPGTDDGITPLLVLAVTDQAKADATMSKIAADGTHGTVAYAFRDDYLLVGDDKAEVAQAATAETTLADNPTYTADQASVDGDGKVALAWANLGAVYDVLPAAEQEDASEVFGAAPAGRIVASVHLGSDHIEMTGASHDLAIPGRPQTTPAAHTGLIEGFPATTDLAFTATGLDEQVVTAWQDLATNEQTRGFTALATREAKNLGISLPDDLAAVLGSEFAVGVDLGMDTVDGAIRALTDESDRAITVLGDLGPYPGKPDTSVTSAPGGYLAATSDVWHKQVSAGTGGLGGSDPYAAAIPAEASRTASSILFVNLGGLLDAYGPLLPAEDRANLEPLQALGVTTHADGADARITVRVTTR